LPDAAGCDVLILGAGAAGLLCAIQAGKRGKRVVVLEHNQEPGRKILISGGGRCNFTNLHCAAENFLSGNPHFAKSALARYTPRDFVAFIDRNKIAYHEKKAGQLFCDGSARQVVEALVAESRAAGAKLVLGCRVLGVSGPGPFVVATSVGEFKAPALVVATGGLSIPKIGATGIGYEIARQYGHRIAECRPALVPFVLNTVDKSRYCDLTGVATDVTAECAGKVYRDRILVTHRGLSGPAILQVSSHWRGGGEIRIDLMPGEELPDNDVKEFLLQRIPHRLLNRWLESNGFPNPRWSDARQRSAIGQRLHAWTLRPAGTEGYEKAEVTSGGVDTRELSSQTMESKRAAGIYFVGEVVDVTGELGGFNFQWAWSSGFAAGDSIR
jgi:predicted Rossmann fold flavoprotein